MLANVKSIVALSALHALAACDGGESETNGEAGAAPVSGQFAGVYEVPVTPELAAAATYAVAEVEWSVVNGTAKLEYDLPVGLVGGVVRVEFSGAYDGSAANASLAGAAGTADCTIGQGGISCFETMHGLLPMNPDYALIEAAAASEYAGPAADRVEVARRFA